MRGATHDDLDRYYTPDGLAWQCVCRLGFVAPDHMIAARRFVEPSVGGGAFARAIRRRSSTAHITGVDIDPEAAGLALVDRQILGDFSAGIVPDYPEGPDVVIGNPPFTGDTAVAHVEEALRLAPVVGMILPWGPLGGVKRWRALLDGERRPAWVIPITPRPWPKSIRETAFVVWMPGAEHTRIGDWLEWAP